MWAAQTVVAVVAKKPTQECLVVSWFINVTVLFLLPPLQRSSRYVYLTYFLTVECYYMIYRW